MDPVKESFKRVKEDMDHLTREILSLKQELLEVREELKNGFFKPASASEFPTHNPLNPAYPSDIPTHNPSFKPLKTQNIGFSTGNEGVPTNKPTHSKKPHGRCFEHP